MLQAVVNAFKIADLRRKILFTLAMLVVFRLVAHVPVPGVDLTQLQRALQDNTYGGLFNILNIFSGGTLQNFSVAAMGVYPYITATIIIQLLTGVIPRLTELSKEGEAGAVGRSTIGAAMGMVADAQLVYLVAAPGIELDIHAVVRVADSAKNGEVRAVAGLACHRGGDSRAHAPRVRCHAAEIRCHVGA